MIPINESCYCWLLIITVNTRIALHPTIHSQTKNVTIRPLILDILKYCQQHSNTIVIEFDLFFSWNDLLSVPFTALSKLDQISEHLGNVRKMPKSREVETKSIKLGPLGSVFCTLIPLISPQSVDLAAAIFGNAQKFFVIAPQHSKLTTPKTLTMTIQKCQKINGNQDMFAECAQSVPASLITSPSHKPFHKIDKAVHFEVPREES